MYKRMVLTLAFFCVFSLFASACGATYFIDPNGNDTTGDVTLTNPWYSLSDSCEQVPFSDHIIQLTDCNYMHNNKCNLRMDVDIIGNTTNPSAVTIQTIFRNVYHHGYILDRTT
jgi:hypothetical protein